MTRTGRTLLILQICVGLYACKPEPCDPGFELRDGSCWAVRDAGGDSGGDGAAAVTPGFGSPCFDDVAFSDCASPANICLRQSAAMPGFCSAVGCDANATLCPMGWTCFDLSLFQPGAPWGCLPP